MNINFEQLQTTNYKQQTFFIIFAKKNKMSHAITFDTLAYAKKMISAGFTQQQAEMQAEALAEIIDEHIATKQDIRDIKKEMREMEQRIIIKLGAMMAASIAIIAAIVKLL